MRVRVGVNSEEEGEKGAGSGEGGLARATTTCAKPFKEELLELLAAVETRSVLNSERKEDEKEDVLGSFLQSSHERRARFWRAGDRREELRRHVLDELVASFLQERLEERRDLADDLH